MGNDGGSIPKRNELVKEKQKEVKPDQNALTIAIWFFCAISKRLLQEPVVSCALGKLYNKDAVIEYLLNNGTYGDGDTICSHIKSLKDIITLNLATNPTYKENSTSNVSYSDQGTMKSRFVCPITMKEMNGKLKFVYLNTCGCTFSEQGLKEIPSDTCIQCGKPFNGKDIVTINPNSVEQEKIKLELIEKRSKSNKKEKKRKQKAEQEKSATVIESSSSSIPISSLSSSSSSSSSSSPPSNDKQQQQENKRKRDNENPSNVLVELSSSSPSKRIATTVQPQIGDGGAASSVTAAVNQKVQEHLAVANTKAKKSKAIQSIYTKKRDNDDKVSDSYLVRGTFNRYAA